MANGIVNTGMNLAGNALNFFGLGNWQLTTASYNGVNFMVAVPGLFNTNQIPFSGAYNALEALTGSADLPYGTSLGTYYVSDDIKRKLVVHPIPGYTGNFIEDMGWEGERFTLEAIFFGIGYQVLLETALVAMLNVNKTVPSESLNVLVHPVRGVINNCWLSSYRITHASTLTHACRLTLNFIADEVPTTANTSLSSYAQLYQKIQEIASIVGNVSGALNAASFFFSGSQFTENASYFYNGSPRGEASNLNPLVRQQIDTLNTLNADTNQIYLSCVAVAYQYLKPAGFSDFYLDSLQINLNLLPELFRYVQILTDSEITALVSFYIGVVDALITQYSTYNLDTIFPDVINRYKQTVVLLTQFCQLLLQLDESQTLTYIVPTTMSLRQVLFNLDIDFNQDLTQLLVNNRDVLISTNYIPAGTVLKIRGSNA